jgi:chromosomal replication initiator protein
MIYFTNGNFILRLRKRQKGGDKMPLKESDKRFWARVNELAKTNIKQATYDYFIAPAKLLSVKGNQARILVNSGMHKQYWRNQDDLITTASLEVYGDVLEYALYSKEELSEKETKELEKNVQNPAPDGKDGITELGSNYYPYPSNLMEKYSFENFIQGESNLMTLAACQTITDKPGAMYNPLFIWGGPGLGKTHLLHATGNEFVKKHPSSHALYASSETFVTDYVNASRKNQMENFVNKYRNLDMLLLDDVQFFSDKEGTINEFFSTFNVLHDKGAQIVITSDRSAAELTQLTERLVSRFSWGLPTNITAPNFETRMAILMNKAEKTGLYFPDETISYIAGQLNSNVRELEGALNQVEFAAKMQKLDTVDIATAEKALQTLKSSTTRVKRSNLTIQKIKDEVAKYYHLPVAELISPKRVKDIAFARQVAMYLIREMLGTSLPTIGQEFGKRDHTTVMYAVKVISDKMKSDSDTQRDIDNLKRKLEG